VNRVPALANHGRAAHQIDGDGEAGDRELFKLPVVEVTERLGIASCSSFQSWRYLRSIGSKWPRRYLYRRYHWLPRGRLRKNHDGRRSVEN
jgi:hypothetical protein